MNWINFNYNETDDVLEHNDNLELNVDGGDDAGEYECVAQNGVDEKQSKIIKVNINGIEFNFVNFALKILNYFYIKMWSWNQYLKFLTKTLHRHCY